MIIIILEVTMTKLLTLIIIEFLVIILFHSLAINPSFFFFESQGYWEKQTTKTQHDVILYVILVY